MNYWQNLSIKLKEANFADDYINIILYLFRNRPIEGFIDASPIAVTDTLNLYIMLNGLNFVAMLDDINDAQQTAKISKKEYTCGQV